MSPTTDTPAQEPQGTGPAAGVTVYGIPNCDSVKRARAWFASHGVAVRFHDFKREGLPAALLDGLIAQLGWERVLNRQGSTWRRLDDSQRAAVVDAATARIPMLAQPSLVKRPVVAWPDGSLSLGFDAEDFARRCR